MPFAFGTGMRARAQTAGAPSASATGGVEAATTEEFNIPLPKADADARTVTKLSNVRLAGERSGGCAINAFCWSMLERTSQTIGAADQKTNTARPTETALRSTG